jgi:Xaa-Pro dipeptidase
MPEVEALRRSLADHRLAAAVMTSYESVSSFAHTNIATQPLVPYRLAFFFVPVEGPTALLLCNIEEAEAREVTSADDVSSYVEFAQDPIDALAELLAERGHDASAIGFELLRLSHGHVERLRAAAPRLDIRPADELINVATTIKSADEADALGQKALATQRAVERAAASLKVGATERECLRALIWELGQTGGRPEFGVFGSGELTMLAHPPARDVAIVEGDLWRVDCGARFPDGQLSDLARTGVVGEPDAEQQECMQLVIESQSAAIELAVPGRPAKELYRAAARVMERGGFDLWIPHVGHGMGVGLHELPSLDPGNDAPLKAGMVLNIEPLMAVPGRNETYHTEDLVAVTEDGPHLLTQPQTELLRISA